MSLTAASVHCPSQNPPRKSRATFHSESRKIIAKVAEYCDIEKDNKMLLFPLNQSLKRVAVYMAKSISTIKKIEQFTMSHSDETPKMSSKKR
ncbi:hypothetical protein ANN_13243 [Periplaneta americana]|uniref:Uncharacterized protein n=1 Tax=Periplaneta americana TaxID=6978 RepID=A0ABQ8TJ97_PERAM|nr:hypothetical protein ANN_13243 [Periplaneta americana]